MKKSFVDCSKCKLVNSSQGKIFETNCKDDLTNIDKFYITLQENWNDLLKILEKKNFKYVIMSPIVCDYKEIEELELKLISEICTGNLKKLINSFER